MHQNNNIRTNLNWRKMVTGIFIRNIIGKVRSSSWLLCMVSFKYLKCTRQFLWKILMGCTLTILYIFSEGFSCILLYSKHIPETVNNEGLNIIRTSPPELLFYKGVLQICSKFTPMQKCDFNEFCFPVNLQHIFRTSF